MDNEQLLEFQIQRSVEGNGSAEVKCDTCAVLTRSLARVSHFNLCASCPTWVTASAGLSTSPFSSLKLNERKAHFTIIQFLLTPLPHSCKLHRDALKALEWRMNGNE